MIIYEGKSLLDRKTDIVVIAIPVSGNTKTGNMVQTYILVRDKDTSPMLASKNGLDFAICGNCIHRGVATKEAGRKTAKNRTCYVTLVHGPNNVWKAYHKGAYTTAARGDIWQVGAGKLVRLGTYGDPAAVPSYVWEELLRVSIGHTGYSHQAEIKASSYDSALYMKSVDSAKQAMEAWGKGERTYRVVSQHAYRAGVDGPIDGREILCPATKEGGKRTTCIDCLLCSGTAAGLKQPKSIVAVAHGASAGGII
jgi:hypothetical protein